MEGGLAVEEHNVAIVAVALDDVADLKKRAFVQDGRRRAESLLPL